MMCIGEKQGEYDWGLIRRAGRHGIEAAGGMDCFADGF